MQLRCAENMYQPSRRIIDSIGPGGLVATKLDFKVDACSGQHKLAIQRRLTGLVSGTHIAWMRMWPLDTIPRR
jgi:hypothetical protein